MKLLIYKIKLAIHLSFFILKLSANVSNKTKPLILSIFTMGLFLLIAGISFLSINQPTPTVAISTVVPQNSNLFVKKDLNSNQIDDQITFWENILTIQPESRDVLLNLSHLYSANNLEDKAHYYKNRAIKIDPNNPLFE